MPSSATAQSGALTFRSPRVFLDVLMLAIVLPIAVAALAFLTMIPLAGVAVALGTERTGVLITVAVIIAVTIALVALRLKMFWSITLDADCLRVGRWWPRRFAYDSIRYISAGRSAAPLDAVGQVPAIDPVPLAFSRGVFRQHRLFLKRADASRCLRELYARCPNAAALDVDGTILPPRNPGALPYGQFKLAEALAVRAACAWGTALLGVASLAVPAVATGSRLRDLEHHIQTQRFLWIVVPAVPALLAYGYKNVRDLRRVIGDRTRW